MSIVITLPQHYDFGRYLAEQAEAAAVGLVSNYRVSTAPRVQPGEWCYLVWRGMVRGRQRIDRVEHKPHGFTCETTGKFWPPGIYIQRSGMFYDIEPRPMKGFQGWRYFKEDTE